MSYDAFLKGIVRRVNNSLSPGVNARLRSIRKNNNVMLDGLVISDPDSCASPTIYLNEYYDDYYCRGMDEEAICSMILEQYRSSLGGGFGDLDFFDSFEKVKDRIIFRVISYSRNQELLKEIPHIKYLDLAVTFLYLLESDSDTSATIQIRNDHTDMWEVTCEDLATCAEANTPHLLQCSVNSLGDILSSMMPSSCNEALPEADDLTCPMFILTNKTGLHGAGCILYPNITKQLSARFNGDYFILPSSIHELLLIPCSDISDFSPGELNKMVRTVNTTQLCEEEILSDHAYLYSASTNSITCCTDY